MSKGKKIPGVDEKALGLLAKQFPGSQMSTPAPDTPERAAEKPEPSAPQQPKKAPAGKESTRKESAGKAQAKPAATSGIKAEKTDAVSASTATKPAPQQRSGGRGLAYISLLFSIVAVVLALAILAPPELRPWLQSKIDNPRVVDFLTGARYATDQKFGETDATLQALRKQLDDATARIGEIEAVGGSNEAAASRVIAVEESLAGLDERIVAGDEKIAAVEDAVDETEERVNALDDQSEAAAARLEALAGSVDSMASTVLPRLDGLEQTLEQLQADAAGPQRLYLHALKIRLAMQGSGPFLDDVSAAQALAGNSDEVSAALTRLAALAATGAPTVDQLRVQFSERLAPRIRRLDADAPRSFVGRLGNWVDGLLENSAPSGGAGMGEHAIADLAQESLSKGNLATAIERLAALKGMSAVLLAEWMKDAQARLEMDRAGAALMAKSFDQMARRR